jgi:PAS domain S-box-containing protein
MRRRSSASGPAKSRSHTIKRTARKASINHQSGVEPPEELELRTRERDLSLDRSGRNSISSDITAKRLAATNRSTAAGVAAAAEHERQFRELLEFCPAALLVVDEDGRLLFHNARLREILGYCKDELDLCDTRMHWHDLDQRTRIINQLRDQGGQILNEKVTWRTKKGTLVHLLLSYVQVGYRGGHISFLGGKRVLWVYDITALTQHEAQVAQQEHQLREILDYSPAAVNVVDEDGRLLFHNRRLRELTGYERDELELFDSRRFWHDLAHRARVVELLRTRGGQLLNEEVVWKTKQGELLNLLISYVQVTYHGGHVAVAGGKRLYWLYDITPLRRAEQARQRTAAR